MRLKTVSLQAAHFLQRPGYKQTNNKLLVTACPLCCCKDRAYKEKLIHGVSASAVYVSDALSLGYGYLPGYDDLGCRHKLVNKPY